MKPAKCTAMTFYVLLLSDCTCCAEMPGIGSAGVKFRSPTLDEQHAVEVYSEQPDATGAQLKLVSEGEILELVLCDVCEVTGPNNYGGEGPELSIDKSANLHPKKFRYLGDALKHIDTGNIIARKRVEIELLENQGTFLPLVGCNSEQNICCERIEGWVTCGAYCTECGDGGISGNG